MKPVLLLPTLLAAQLSYAQTFTEIPLAPPFAGVFDGAVAFSDVDLDGDEDALITGTGSAWAPVAKLYLNDGRGRFSEKPNSPFEEVFVSSLAFADADGDGDEDVLISGQGSGNSIPRLYLNNGRGEFAQYMGLPFEPVTHSSLAFADIDGDRDLDLLLTGQSVTLNAPVAKLYANDGRGRFHEISGAPFTGVLSASIAFADVDGNGSPDVLIAGASKAGILSSKLYLNNGKGRFAEQTNTPFTGVYSGSAAFADADGDGDQDLLLTGNRNGASESAAPLSKLYLNDGRGVFTEKTEVPFINVCYSAIAFADVDSDGDEDLLLTGNSQSLFRIAKLYLNDGKAGFSERTGTPFDGGYNSSVAFSDVDLDGDLDVLIAGLGSPGPMAKLYTNAGSGRFAERTGTPFECVYFGSATFADIDGDGDQDLLLTGTNSSGALSKLYVNDGQGRFSEKSGALFEGVYLSAAAFADVDGDKDPDAFLTGRNSAGLRVAKLYLNDGQGHFSEKPGTPFVGVYNSALAFADVDGDKDPDLLLTGINAAGDPVAVLYINEGQGKFTEKKSTPFEGVYLSAVLFADADQDGDADAFLCGGNRASVPIAKLYLNDGKGHFSEKPGTPFEGVYEGSAAFADVDGDGDPDVLLSGLNAARTPITRLYLNQGKGQYADAPNAPFPGLNGGSAAFADVDGDKDPDVLLTGISAAKEQTAVLFLNDGRGGFGQMKGAAFEGVYYSALAFADIDGDGDPDVLLSGLNRAGDPITTLYKNDGMATSGIDLRRGPDYQFLVFPNPVLGGQVHIRITTEQRSLTDIQVFDAAGRLLHRQQNQLLPGENTVSIDISRLERGPCFIRVEDGAKTGTQKVLIQ